MNRNPSTAGSKRPRSRQSIAHMPTSEQFDKENMTADVSSMQRKKSATVAEKKKSRSKSLGPGGLDALNEESGNSRKVRGLDATNIGLWLICAMSDVFNSANQIYIEADDPSDAAQSNSNIRRLAQTEPWASQVEVTSSESCRRSIDRFFHACACAFNDDCHGD